MKSWSPPSRGVALKKMHIKALNAYLKIGMLQNLILSMLKSSINLSINLILNFKLTSLLSIWGYHYKPSLVLTLQSKKKLVTYWYQSWPQQISIIVVQEEVRARGLGIEIGDSSLRRVVFWERQDRVYLNNENQKNDVRKLNKNW